MDALGRRGGADIVAVGSSMVNAAVDPAALTRELGGRRPVFNAALNGAGARLLERWTLEVVVPRLRPKTVVIGVSSRELNDRGLDAAHAYDVVIGSRGFRDATGDGTFADRLEDRIAESSYLVRYRSVLRQPSRWGGRKGSPVGSRVNDLGVLRALRIFDNATYATTPRLSRATATRSLNDLTFGGRETAALGRLVTGLTSRGIRVVLLEMPITEDEIRLHPAGAADYARFEALLARFAAAHPAVRVFDMRERFPDTADYRDPHHLNGTGKARFTGLLADVLKASS